MKQLFIYIAFALSLVFLSGCALLEVATTRTINGYCAEIDPGVRAAIRKRINADVHPHTVAITCMGDP